MNYGFFIIVPIGLIFSIFSGFIVILVPLVILALIIWGIYSLVVKSWNKIEELDKHYYYNFWHKDTIFDSEGNPVGKMSENK